MLTTDEIIVIAFVVELDIGSAHQTKRGAAGQFFKQEGKVLRRKFKIGIKEGHGIECKALHALIAGTQSIHLAGKITLNARVKMQELDPRMTLRIAKHKCIGLIG